MASALHRVRTAPTFVACLLAHACGVAGLHGTVGPARSVALPAEARCCAAAPACAATAITAATGDSAAARSGCAAWCQYTAGHKQWFIGDGCFAWRHLCPHCYPAGTLGDGLPFRLRVRNTMPLPAGPGTGAAAGAAPTAGRAGHVRVQASRKERWIERVAEVTHVQGPFLVYVATHSIRYTLLLVYAWETLEWLNNRFGFVDSYSWDDPLDDVESGVVGILWGLAWVQQSRCPALVPAPTGSRSVALVLQGLAFATVSSLLMARAWHVGAGDRTFGYTGLLSYACASFGMMGLIGALDVRWWAGREASTAAGGCAHVPRNCAVTVTPRTRRAFWTALSLTNLAFGLVFALSQGAVEGDVEVSAGAAQRNSAILSVMAASCLLARVLCGVSRTDLVT